MSPCPIDGTASVTRFADELLAWERADPAIHVADEITQDADARAFIESRYVLGDWCEDRQAWHATTDRPFDPTEETA